MSDILRKILATKAKEVAAARAIRPPAAIELGNGPTPIVSVTTPGASIRLMFAPRRFATQTEP